jgi:preprotein translocase SecE subunit
VAKSRAQRKAERRKREAQQARQAEADRRDDSRAQHDTQVPESADVIEAELAERGADIDALREEGESDGKSKRKKEKAPAPSRADVGAPADAEAAPKESRRERKRRERAEAEAKEERRRAREKKPVVEEKQRGAVTGFIASCWAELKRVQWPDRDTLVQASAVTILFVAVMAFYLGVLDAAFSELVDLFIG